MLFRSDAGLTDVKVIATGGLGKVVSENTDSIDVYDGDLTLKGLLYIYQKKKNGTHK